VIIKRPVGTVKARISRGRAMLRQRLEKAAGNGIEFVNREIYDGRF
jgi:DNA-directed RNA polymerase specialized sigma24 family protein